MEELIIFKNCHVDKDFQFALFKHYHAVIKPVYDFMNDHEIEPSKIEFEWCKLYATFETRVAVIFDITEQERFLLVMKYG